MRKIKIKNVFMFLLFLLLYILPYFFIEFNQDFYNSLNKINIPSIVFRIVWSILYSLMALYLVLIYDSLTLKNKRLIVYLIINYFANVLYVLLFFEFEQLFLPFVMCAISFISILFAWMETLLINKKLSYLLVPNVLWSLFACVLSGYVFLFN